MKVLITCPPMLGMQDEFRPLFAEHGYEIECPETVQTLTEAELIERVPDCEGWIIGDDPASRSVLEAGRKGRLRALVKWGVGVDNVDFAAAEDLGLPVSNTPGMFGGEVADLALGYIIALARETHAIDRGVRAGGWPKLRGRSLAGARLGLVGLGDIGRNIARRAAACDMQVIGYDPALPAAHWPKGVEAGEWPHRLDECDFLVLACALTESSHHLVDRDVLAAVKPGLRLVNISRGPLVDEGALLEALEHGRIHSAALDVFEQEPLPPNSALRDHDRCIFGSHNGSNTEQAVRRASEQASAIMLRFLEETRG